MSDNETNITNIFNVSGHHNSVEIGQSFENTTTGGDVGKILQIVLGFVAMIVLSPVWVPYLLLSGARNKLIGGDADE